MNEEEKKAIEYLRKWVHWETAGERNLEGDIETALNLIDKQKEKIEELNSEFAINTEIHKRDMRIKELEEVNNCLHETNNEYINKDKVLKALGYEENDEEYKRIYKNEELILSLIDTLLTEVSRLEDIEDKKVELELEFVNAKRDKYWQEKIRKTLLKFQNEYGEDLETTDRLFIGKEVIQYGEDMLDEIAKELNIDLLDKER